MYQKHKSTIGVSETVFNHMKNKGKKKNEEKPMSWLTQYVVSETI